MQECGRKLNGCAVALALLVAEAASRQAQQPIRIGASLSKTGEYAERMKELDVNPRMFAATSAVDLPSL